MPDSSLATAKIMLLVSSDPILRSSLALIFKRAGYIVSEAPGKAQAEITLAEAVIDLLVIDHTVRMEERLGLVWLARQLTPHTHIVVLHHSGALGSAVDVAIDSREGPQAILDSIAALFKKAVASVPFLKPSDKNHASHF